jgi:hypothetical protein
VGVATRWNAECSGGCWACAAGVCAGEVSGRGESESESESEGESEWCGEDRSRRSFVRVAQAGGSARL